MQASSREATTPEKLAEQLRTLRMRDLQLWSIAFLTMLVMALGIFTLVYPNLEQPATPIYIQFGYLPQLAAGLIALVVLLNLYLANERRRSDAKRIELVRDAAMQEVLRQATILDPVTQLLDRRYLEYLLPIEMARTNRTGAEFTLMLIEAISLQSIRERQGEESANAFLMETTRVLRGNFRGSDSIMRYDAAQFLVIMPGTTKKQASIALQRLVERVDDWNVHSQDPWEMLLDCRLAACQPGDDCWSVLRQTERALAEDSVPLLSKAPHTKSKAPATVQN
jgi:diguanylate cyclase (GGDEF)-like protein